MERVQTQFLIYRTGGCSFGSVGPIFAHVARFWDVGPALAPYWAMLSHFSCILWFLLAFVGQELGPYWACLGPFWAMLGHFGPCWTRVGTILGLSWAILGYVGTFWAMLEPYWAHLGPFWAIFGFVSAFVLDSGISSSLTFRPCKRVQKTPKNTRKTYTKNTRKKINLWTTFLMVFAAIFWLFLFLSWGMLQLGYVCLISGLCWALWVTESAGTAQGVDVALP